MKLSKYSCNDGEKRIPRNILYPLYWDLQKLTIRPPRKGTREIRKAIEKIIESNGWSSSVRVAPDSNITITSINNKVGLCLQFGNMARFYADLLKLQLMFNNGYIESAIYLLPMREFSIKLGSNVANFERLTNELNLFHKIINVPLVIIGIQGE